MAPSIHDIKHQVRLEEIIQQRGVVLRPTQGGGRLEGHCPFHAYDSTPSFNVYLQSQRYHCFGCGANGDVIDFVQAFDLCSCQEALARVSENILPQTQEQRNRLLRHRMLPAPFPEPAIAVPTYQAVLTDVQQQYHQTLRNNHPLCDVLYRERGITHAGIISCQLGYVDGSIQKSGWKHEEAELLQKIGLLNARKRERLLERLIVPEWNPSGCIWMIGRQLPAYQPLHVSATKGSPKYLGLSLPKPLLGSERGYHLCKEKAVVRAIFVVEGALDYVLMTQWHLPVICVALIGTHASQHQFEMLLDLQQQARNVPILLSLDADDAGRHASHHLYQRLLQLQRPVIEMAPIADAKDIGDLGIHPHGQLLVSAAIEQVMTAFT